MQRVEVYDKRPGRSGRLEFQVADMAELKSALKQAGVNALVVAVITLCSEDSSTSRSELPPVDVDQLDDRLLPDLEWGPSADYNNSVVCTLTAVR